MNEEFARTMALLRREKGIGQRAAASDLGISQALLSHYENGLREPGIPFILRACDYFNVSADFLLGRTLNRNGTVIATEELYDITTSRDRTVGRGGILAVLSRKLLLNSIGLLFDLLSLTGNRNAIAAATEYLSDAVYVIFRRLYQSNPKNDPGFFSVSNGRFAAGLVDADMKCAEVRLVEALGQPPEKDCPPPDLSNSALKQNFPELYTSLLKLLHSSGERINRLAKENSSGDS